MEKIKDITKVIIPEGSVLIEIIKPKRLILAPDGTQDEDSYFKVIVVGNGVPDIEVGDICIKYASGIYVYIMNEGKQNERRFAVVFRSSMNIVIKPDNFVDTDVMINKVTL